MKINQLMEQYLECLDKYFSLLDEVSKLPTFPRQIEKCQQQVMDDLTAASNSLHYCLNPSLKEK